MRTYFRIVHDFPQKGRWYLNGLKDSAGSQLDVRDFTHGEAAQTEPQLRLSSPIDGHMLDVVPPLTMSLRRPGPPLDFTFGDFDVPVAERRVSELLTRVAGADIQLFPVTIAGHAGEYDIVNVVRRINCIDPIRTDITYWTEGDGLPDMVGKTQMIVDLVIDPAQVDGHHLFRVQGWEVALVAYEEVKDALEAAHVTGVTFRCVSPD